MAEYGGSMKIKTVDDKEFVKKVRLALAKNDNYCPCRVNKTPDTKCMCKEFRESEVGTICHCGLYEKIEE